MNSDTRPFEIAAIGGLVSGYLLTERGFDKIHELAEHVIGHPLWTHEFAEKTLWNRCRAALVAQHPDLADMPAFDEAACHRTKDAGDITTYLNEYVANLRARYGDTLQIQKGEAQRTESPMESMQRIAPDKPVIGIVVKNRDS